jgi:hypothetical protein
VGRAVEALLQGAQHMLGIGGRTHAEQPEVIDREIQPLASQGT